LNKENIRSSKWVWN